MKHVLIDSDTGLDDALGLIHELPRHRERIVGITTVFGNAPVDDCTLHALEIVELLGVDVPVIKGASHPFGQGCGPAPQVHGLHGRGALPAASPARAPAPGYAANYILEQVAEKGGDLAIVAMGRLTNIALAFLLDPELMKRVGRIYWMGGAIAVSGNVSAIAEANVAGDPDAAAIVCASGLPITILPLDVTMNVRISEADLRSLDGSQHPAIQHLLSITPYYLDFYESILGVREAALHCGLLLSIALDETLITEEHALEVAIDTSPGVARGAMIADRRGLRTLRDASGDADVADTGKPRVIFGVNEQRYYDQFIADLQAMDRTTQR